MIIFRAAFDTLGDSFQIAQIVIIAFLIER
jgi:hypothetical protein